MGELVGSPTERVLRLAAFVDERRDELTLSRITAAVPGYPECDRDHAGDIVKGARGWEAARRAVRRDVADLEAFFGIALTYDEATHRYQLEPSFFTPGERAALISACAIVDVQGVDRESSDAIGAAVDASSYDAIVWIDRRASMFQTARLERRRVQFSYRGRRRTIDPLAIGSRRNLWYVVGRDHDVDALRLFRLDRVDAEPPIELGANRDAFELPDDFDAPSALRLDPNDWGPDQPVEATIRVARHRVGAFQRDLGGVVIEHDVDHVVVAVTVRHRTSFRVRVTAFGDDAKLIGPAELVDDVVNWLRAMVEAGVG